MSFINKSGERIDIELKASFKTEEQSTKHSEPTTAFYARNILIYAFMLNAEEAELETASSWMLYTFKGMDGNRPSYEISPLVRE